MKKAGKEAADKESDKESIAMAESIMALFDDKRPKLSTIVEACGIIACFCIDTSFPLKASDGRMISKERALAEYIKFLTQIMAAHSKLEGVH